MYRTLYDLRDVEPDDFYLNDKNPRDRAIEPIFDALCDDLNTSQAIHILNSINDRVARYIFIQTEHPQAATEKELQREKANFLRAGKLLGILQEDPVKWLGYDVSVNDDVEKLLAERTEAKKAKNFKRADEIRDEVKALGFTIEDTPEGPKARKI